MYRISFSNSCLKSLLIFISQIKISVYFDFALSVSSHLKKLMIKTMMKYLLPKLTYFYQVLHYHLLLSRIRTIFHFYELTEAITFCLKIQNYVSVKLQTFSKLCLSYDFKFFIDLPQFFQVYATQNLSKLVIQEVLYLSNHF